MGVCQGKSEMSYVEILDNLEIVYIVATSTYIVCIMICLFVVYVKHSHQQAKPKFVNVIWGLATIEVTFAIVCIVIFSVNRHEIHAD